jgi:NAD-dependent SIR2 family protein deacetylase
METSLPVSLARDVLSAASSVVLCTGAGMGVDSGLPDFRGDEGFWNAYPAFRSLGLSFRDLANPEWFRTDPHRAWGFYGHRFNLYRDTVPHAGHTALTQALRGRPAFAYTSNVDGQLLKAGWSPRYLVECHGRVRLFQCADACGELPWDASDARITVDVETMRAEGPLPRCPACGGIARPNILMFGDWEWNGLVTDAQQDRFEAWLRVRRPSRGMVVIECGAGTAIPSVRHMSETLQREGATLIRINPREAQGPKGTISFACGASQGLNLIAREEKQEIVMWQSI